ncbi:ABC transporter substrate-binding protein [Pusillimonas sp. MFBS29]|uniref:ABC transporter substrate-binding protein n=1 Tax=Pusillimonas sp. MFBS29 TaxID=2886690 RepID=UPI001D112F41|nr:ABC transporter substrate-binding protein [Pusillimonas sp. MFBS29]MCC2595849.1 ABC transporter substrate-binding protein [Pusillimonas sp. MFBS29]
MRMVMKTAAALMFGIGLMTGAAAQEVLKIGVVSALDGPGSEWGRGVDGGTKIAAKEVNDAGGLKVGDKTYKIEVISYDDAYKAAQGVSAATRLIEQDQVKFILGPLGSASGLAVKPMYEQNKVIGLVNTYTPQMLKDVEYIFRVLPTTSEIVEPMVSWIKQHNPEIKKVAVLSPNDQTGWDSQKAQVAAYEKFEYDIVGTELFERSTRDFQSFITRIMVKQPDLIELDTTPPSTAGLIIRQARELGYKGMFSKIGGPGVPEIVKAAGKEFAEGTITYVAADMSNEKYKWLEQQYTNFYPAPMNAFNVFFYDGARMLFKAMQNAGTVTDTDKVRDALAEVTPFEGMQGALVWGGKELYGNNHQIQAPVFVGVIKDGKEVIVEKIDVK